MPADCRPPLTPPPSVSGSGRDTRHLPHDRLCGLAVSAPLLRRASNFVDTRFLVITIELTGASGISQARHLFCLTLGHLAFRRGRSPWPSLVTRAPCGEFVSWESGGRNLIQRIKRNIHSHHPTASGVTTVKSRLPRSLRPSRKNRGRWTSQLSRSRGLRVETLEDRRMLTGPGGVDMPTRLGQRLRKVKASTVPFVSGQMLVQFKPGTSSNTIQQILQQQSRDRRSRRLSTAWTISCW